jgi:hypothetical protein
VRLSNQFVAFSFVARAVPLQACAAAHIAALVSHRMLRASREALAFPLARAFARSSRLGFACGRRFLLASSP